MGSATIIVSMNMPNVDGSSLNSVLTEKRRAWLSREMRPFLDASIPSVRLAAFQSRNTFGKLPGTGPGRLRPLNVFPCLPETGVCVPNPKRGSLPGRARVSDSKQFRREAIYVHDRNLGFPVGQTVGACLALVSFDRAIAQAIQ